MEKEQRIVEIKAEIFDMWRQVNDINQRRDAKLKELESLEKDA